MLFESDRLQFDFFREADFEDYYSLMKSLPVMRLITGKALPRSTARRRFEKALSEQSPTLGTGRFKVKRRGDGAFIGLAKLVPFEGNYELGYALLEEMWGKGYGFEICQAVVNWSEQLSHIDELHAITALENVASKRILHKCGFRLYKKDLYEGEPAEFLKRPVRKISDNGTPR